VNGPPTALGVAISFELKLAKADVGEAERFQEPEDGVAPKGAIRHDPLVLVDRLSAIRTASPKAG